MGLSKKSDNPFTFCTDTVCYHLLYRRRFPPLADSFSRVFFMLLGTREKYLHFLIALLMSTLTNYRKNIDKYWLKISFYTLIN